MTVKTAEQFPDSAWLITACDLPLLTTETITELLSQRDPSKIATAFRLAQNDYPEPLMTIWEPAAAKLRQFLTKGNKRLIDFLKQSEVKIIRPSDPGALFNMNDPEAKAIILDQLGF